MPRTLARRRIARDTEAYTPQDDAEEATTAQEDRPRRSRREAPEAPAGRRTAPSDDGPSRPGGWGAFTKQKSESGDFPENLTLSDEAILIKFLDAEPFTVYQQHWIERPGKKSFVCLNDNCPLCDDLGDRPRLQVGFNVVDFSNADEPEIKVWIVGTRVAGALKNFAADKKTSPLDREDLYWSVSKTGKKSQTQYNINPVKQRDAAEDWDIEPLTAEELSDFAKEKYDDSIIRPQTRKQLAEVVDELLDAD